MSFKIFLLQLTGKIKPTETIEKKRNKIETDYYNFLKTESSDELKSFLDLKKYVESDSFARKKKETENLKIKGSKEEKQLKEFNRLRKSGNLRKYFAVLNSADLTKYEKENSGEKMAEFQSLKKYIKGDGFAKDKKTARNTIFKDSPEEKKWKKFHRLKKSAEIKAYEELNGSEKLKKHEAFRQSDKLKRFNELKNTNSSEKTLKKELKTLKRDSELKTWTRFEKSKKLKLYKETVNNKTKEIYEELKEYVSSDEYKKQVSYLKDKKKFEKSDAYKKFLRYKKLRNDETIKFVQKYGESKLYKNYLAVKDSAELKRYNELKTITESDDYKKRKAWLEDKKRWEKTEDFKKHQQYVQEQTKPEFVNYFKYKDSTDFDFYKKWEVIFEDSFDASKLNDEKWSTVKTSGKALGQNFAMPGDLGIFTASGNIKTGRKLTVRVKKEKSKGLVWQPSSGFVPNDFEYTSGMVTSAGNFSISDGIVEAKIKFNPVKQVVSSFYLTAGSDMPRVNLIEMGMRNSLGFSTLSNGKVNSTGLDVANLKKGTYIFSLEKIGGKFKWRINETEVLELTNPGLDKKFELNASSLLVKAISGNAADFEIEWVKCFRKKWGKKD